MLLCSSKVELSKGIGRASSSGLTSIAGFVAFAAVSFNSGPSAKGSNSKSASRSTPPSVKSAGSSSSSAGVSDMSAASILANPFTSESVKGFFGIAPFLGLASGVSTAAAALEIPNSNSYSPIFTRSPSAKGLSSPFHRSLPLTFVPLVERSKTTIRPASFRRSSACWREILRS